VAFASSPTSAPARQESARDRTRHCVLVVAAAGYGKSTRLESWAVQAGGRCLTAPAAGSLDTASVDDASRDASHLARLAIDDLDEVARVDLLRRPILDRTATDDLVRAGLPLPDPRAHPGVQAFRAIPLVARAVRHRTDEEIWFVLRGSGRMWRRPDGGEPVEVDLAPGVSLTIPVGTAFQFRSTGREPLEVLGVTMPPWPGDGEAVTAEGPRESTAG